MRRNITISSLASLILLVGASVLLSANHKQPGDVRSTSKSQMDFSLAARPAALTAPTTDDKGLWLLLQPSGFAVKEINIPAGDYFVVVQNATGLGHFSFRLETDSHVRILEVRLPRYKKYWKQTVHLAAGSYTVTELDHSDWVCHITVN